jgi:DNA-binding XRE family transcriptional regulator
LFCLQDKGEAGAYNPSGKMARKLAEKFKEAK